MKPHRTADYGYQKNSLNFRADATQNSQTKPIWISVIKHCILARWCILSLAEVCALPSTCN